MNNLPQHLAIIMDGNGRWAKSKGLPRTAGHAKGAERTKDIVEACASWGVKYLTVYAFSSENWGREPEEVGFLLDLMIKKIKNEIEELHHAGIKLVIIGEREKFDKDTLNIIENAEKLTKNNDKMQLIVALSYGARQEILKAAGSQNFEQNLYTYTIPDPDLLIRTGGEKRISNFLLWQIAYTELYFTDILWPDFSREQLEIAFADFAKRERRFGK